MWAVSVLSITLYLAVVQLTHFAIALPVTPRPLVGLRCFTLGGALTYHERGKNDRKRSTQSLRRVIHELLLHIEGYERMPTVAGYSYVSPFPRAAQPLF